MESKEKIATSCAIILSALLTGILVYYVTRDNNTPQKSTLKLHVPVVHVSNF